MRSTFDGDFVVSHGDEVAMVVISAAHSACNTFRLEYRTSAVAAGADIMS
jgi:hypothetical protein